QTAIIEQEIGRPLTQQERAQIANGTLNLQVPAGGQQAQGESLDFIPRMSTFTGPSGIGVGRTPEEQAALTSAAQEQVQLAYLPQRQQIETQGALERAAGEAGIKNDAEIGIANAKRSREANDTLSLLQQAERLIPASTGSGIGAARDRAAALVGQTTEGANAIAALKTLSGQLVAKMPRMEGPQSDRDVQMYKDMAGNLADPDVPREQRLAALNMIRILNERYSGGN